MKVEDNYPPGFDQSLLDDNNEGLISDCCGAMVLPDNTCSECMELCIPIPKEEDEFTNED